MPQTIDSLDSVYRILRDYPETLPVFLRWKTDCIGCLLGRFCTLQDMAEQYQIDLDDFLNELKQTIYLGVKKE